MLCALAGVEGASIVTEKRDVTALPLRIAYADPPYPGMSGFYKDHPDYGGEVDHGELVARLIAEYDGYCLHTASTTLAGVLRHFPDDEPYRVMSWVKPFASFKKHVAVAYAWEPVIVKAARPRPFDGYTTIRDWFAEPITLKKGLTGVKPAAVCHWLFAVMGCEPHDDLDDLYPGSGAVTAAWGSWRSQTRMAV
jgi:hypothetical protein